VRLCLPSACKKIIILIDFTTAFPKNIKRFTDICVDRNTPLFSGLMFDNTDVLLETLSIIAYKQPVTKIEIEHIRGVKTDHAVNKLVEYNLVCEAGRLDAPGRPILFATTEEFLRNFGIESLDDLPVINPDKIEDFKLEAEQEAQLELDI